MLGPGNKQGGKGQQKPGGPQKQAGKSDQRRLLEGMLAAANRATAARIAAGLIMAAERPFSIGEALEVMRDVNFTLIPAPGNPAYKKWHVEKAKDRKRKYD
jgi:hypothetical protein